MVSVFFMVLAGLAVLECHSGPTLVLGGEQLSFSTRCMISGLEDPLSTWISFPAGQRLMNVQVSLNGITCQAPQWVDSRLIYDCHVSVLGSPWLAGSYTELHLVSIKN